MGTFTDDVERLVEAVPAGRVVSYGDVSAVLGRGTARTVGQVMARSQGLPWWRAVRADGTLPTGLTPEAVAAWAEEGIAHRDGVVDLRAHRLTDPELLALAERA